MVEEAAVGVDQAAQVGLRQVGLHRDAAAPDALVERLGPRLQVDHQVRHRRLRPQAVEDLLVERELVVVQREPREQRVLVQKEVADQRLREQVALGEVAQLVDPLEQEEELRRQRVAPAVPVEALEEGVLRGLLQHRRAAEALGDATGQRGLAGADRPLDDDVAVAFEGGGGSVHERKMK